jgi:hypothetical protein
LFNAPVVSSVADDASFSRSRIRLNEDSVSKILHSTLGGSSSSFSVLELEDGLFKFAIFDRRVGLHIYAMKFFACDSFKVIFHLWNQSGLASARISRTLDQGPCYEWQLIKSPKRSSKVAGHHSFADVVRVGLQVPNSVFSRLDFGSVPDSALGSSVRPCSSDHHGPSIMDHSRQGVHSRQGDHSRQGFSNVPLTGANSIPLLKVPNQHFSRVNCSRYFSNYHSCPNCRAPVRCLACFRYGHIADSCRYPARFLGLSSRRLFSSHMGGSKWKDVNNHTWFKSMTGGPTSQEVLQPPHFTVAASSTSIPWILPEVPFLVRGNPSPPERPLASECSPD